MLVVAPLSGHHATLLRDTVRTLLSDHDVYVTDWIDARMVPPTKVRSRWTTMWATCSEFMRHLGTERLHVMSVCQPTVPVLAATSLMAARGRGGAAQPDHDGRADRRAPQPDRGQRVRHATSSLDWFENNVIYAVPPSYPGRGRRVYPGFLQHAGFVAMNPDRHVESH